MITRPPGLTCTALTAGLTMTLLAGCSAQKSEDQAAVESGAMQEPAPEAALKSLEQRSARGELSGGTGPMGPEVLIGTRLRGAPLPAADAQLQQARQLLVAIDTPYQIYDNQGSYVHVAAWRTDGSPASSASVHVGEVQVGTTDEHGSLVFLYPPKGSAQKSAVGSNTVTVVDARDQGIQGRVPFAPNVRTASFASDHLFVYTDRGVYKPGDTIQVRSIGWHLKGDYAPLVEADVEYILKDARGKILGGARRTTDEFGIASMQLPLPRTAPEGLYTLEVAYKSERQQARLQVRDFKPPALTISHDLARFITADQPELKTSITLAPSGGGTLKSADLTLSASVNGSPIFEQKRAIKGNGPHDFALSATQLAKLKKMASEGAWVKLSIKARDGLGREDEVVRELRYTANPYVAVLELDKDQYSTGDAVEVIAKVRDLDGVPLRSAPLTLQLGSERIKGETDASGTAQFSLTMPSSSVGVQLFVPGVKAAIAVGNLNWVAPRAMVSHIAQPIIKERARARVTVRFPANIRPMEKVVHMDVVDTSGAIVNAVLLPIQETREGFVATGEFDSPTWGSMLLTFFALGAPKDVRINASNPQQDIGLLTEGQNLVVHPDRELEILLDGIPDEARPGQTLDITAKIRNAQGELIQASVGAAVVDERILSLKDPLEITPMDAFYEPTLRTMSTTGSKILSWPVVSRNWGGRQQDVALPPFPYLPGGSVNLVASRQEAQGSMGKFASLGEAPEEMTEGEDYDSLSAGTAKPKVKKSMKVSSQDAPPSPIMDKEKSNAGPAESRRSRTKDASAPAKEVTITIRTNFEETSFWQAHMRAEGSVQLSPKLPDAITQQQLIVVASDARGGVGIKRQSIPVTQSLWARADFPKTMRPGDTLMVPVVVQNTSKAAAEVSLTFESSGLTVAAPTRSLSVPAQSSAGVMMQVTATAQGDIPYTLTASANTTVDLIKGLARVEPAGRVRTRSASGTASKKGAFVASWEVMAEDAGNEAYVSVAVPGVTSAMAGLQDFGAIVRDAPLSITSDLATAALLLQYAQRNKIDSPALKDLRQRVMMALGALQFSQQPSGSFSYWRTGRPSTFVTTWALAGLLEAQQLDLPVPQATLTRGGEWLASQVQSDGLVDVSDTAFWEGESELVRLGISAEVFHVLARIPASSRTAPINAALATLQGTFAAYLKRPQVDALPAARSIQALKAMGALDAPSARAAISKLLSARDDKHWEPSWFHSHAGRVDATAAMIEAMVALDKDAWAAEIRDAVSWVLSTRESWGMWHSEHATAAAVRALNAANPTALDYSGTLTVKLDGKLVRTLSLGKQDPFMDALALQHLALGSGLDKGKHSVEVAFDGQPLQATLTHRHWSELPARPEVSAAGYTLAATTTAKTLALGQSAQLNIKLERPATRALSLLHIAPSSLLALDTAALIAAVEASPTLTDLVLTEEGARITLLPWAASTTTLKLAVTAARAGQGAWPSVSVESMDEVLFSVSAGELSVAP